MPVYVRRNGRWYDKRTGEPMPEGPDRIAMPIVRSDIAAYASPIDGHMVDGKREQREDLKRNGCVLSERPRVKFDREEYVERKQRQAKMLERRHADP